MTTSPNLKGRTTRQARTGTPYQKATVNSDASDLAPGQGTEQLLSTKDAALALLASDQKLSRKAGQFLGQIAVDPSPLSEAQAKWLDLLLRRNNFPGIEVGER